MGPSESPAQTGEGPDITGLRRAAAGASSRAATGIQVDQIPGDPFCEALGNLSASAELLMAAARRCPAKESFFKHALPKSHPAVPVLPRRYGPAVHWTFLRCANDHSDEPFPDI